MGGGGVLMEEAHGMGTVFKGKVEYRRVQNASPISPFHSTIYDRGRVQCPLFMIT